MYKVIVRFKDLQDNNHIYNTGDLFPRVGLDVSDERIKELSTSNNRRMLPVIEKVKEDLSESTGDALDNEVGANTTEVEKPKRKTRKRQEK